MSPLAWVVVGAFVYLVDRAFVLYSLHAVRQHWHDDRVVQQARLEGCEAMLKEVHGALLRTKSRPQAAAVVEPRIRPMPTNGLDSVAMSRDVGVPLGGR